MVMDESKYISSQVVGSIAQFLAQLYNIVQTHSSKNERDEWKVYDVNEAIIQFHLSELFKSKNLEICLV